MRTCIVRLPLLHFKCLTFQSLHHRASLCSPPLPVSWPAALHRTTPSLVRTCRERVSVRCPTSIACCCWIRKCGPSPPRRGDPCTHWRIPNNSNCSCECSTQRRCNNDCAHRLSLFNWHWTACHWRRPALLLTLTLPLPCPLPSPSLPPNRQRCPPRHRAAATILRQLRRRFKPHMHVHHRWLTPS
jgi:hypothetical protein